MNVEQVMSRDVRTCTQHDNLARAAELMWENDCGAVPIVSAEGHPVGMLTDRDVCMAAYTQGRRLHDMQVTSAMSKKVYTCYEKDDIRTAEDVMQSARVRRLPVTDGDGKVVGMLSLNDLVCAIAPEGKPQKAELPELAKTFSAICQWRRTS